MERSQYGKLSKTDFWKGFIVAGLGSAITTISTWATLAISNGLFDWEWVTLGKTALVGFIAGLSGYLSKNLFTNSNGEPFKPE